MYSCIHVFMYSSIHSFVLSTILHHTVFLDACNHCICLSEAFLSFLVLHVSRVFLSCYRFAEHLSGFSHNRVGTWVRPEYIQSSRYPGTPRVYSRLGTLVPLESGIYPYTVEVQYMLSNTRVPPEYIQSSRYPSTSRVYTVE